MMNLTKPTDDADQTFLVCISRVKNANLSVRLNACVNVVKTASVEFDAKVTPTQLHTIDRGGMINGNVSIEEMKAVYTDRMAKSGAPGRLIYDKILSSARNGLCPLCSHREAKTLDHHLPKSFYPKLVVAPLNLVPACRECNTGKLHSYPISTNDQTLHPYYDNIEGDYWLKAEVLQTSPPSLRYSVNVQAHWLNELKSRVLFHFDSYQLNTLYRTQAAIELNNIKLHMEMIFKVGGKAGVVKHLTEAAVSRTANNKNSWQSVMYRTLASDDWYCSGGFNN